MSGTRKNQASKPERRSQAFNSASGADKAGDIHAEVEILLSSAAVLIVDDEPGMRNFLKRTLENRCALLEVAGSAEDAEALRLRYHFDLLIVDIRLPGLSGLDWVHQLRERGVETHVIYMTAYADLDMAVAALRNSADDFIMKPFRMEQIFVSIQRSLQKRQVLRENSLLRLQINQLHESTGLIGESERFKEVLELGHRAALSQSPILICGETGTGKEMLARAIHTMSQRDGPFVSINCGTVAPEAFESELIGHLQGAFPGANQSRDGLFLHADRGTLFLDEIGELPLVMQAKLLRILEEKVIRPLGGEREIPVDVRVLAATNRDLGELSESGQFRQDLYFRLNVLQLNVPPLRERLDDIPLLVKHFFETLAAEMRLAPVELMHTDWERLNNYYWPGNVRELKNVVERTLLLGRLPADSTRGESSKVGESDMGYPLHWTMEAVERAQIEAVLASVNNNKSAAARQLGVSRKTLERKQNIWAKQDTLKSEG
ncbi:MAG: sigma-54 dependent transcriptional regulator [Gammaproteobacteria bacterium]|nr:sigma-54 dependent transcriptional regulator [Gammaproteobacteria bacterium]